MSGADMQRPERERARDGAIHPSILSESSQPFHPLHHPTAFSHSQTISTPLHPQQAANTQHPGRPNQPGDFIAASQPRHISSRHLVSRHQTNTSLCQSKTSRPLVSEILGRAPHLPCHLAQHHPTQTAHGQRTRFSCC